MVSVPAQHRHSASSRTYLGPASTSSNTSDKLNAHSSLEQPPATKPAHRQYHWQPSVSTSPMSTSPVSVQAQCQYQPSTRSGTRTRTIINLTPTRVAPLSGVGAGVVLRTVLVLPLMLGCCYTGAGDAELVMLLFDLFCAGVGACACPTPKAAHHQ